MLNIIIGVFLLTMGIYSLLLMFSVTDIGFENNKLLTNLRENSGIVFKLLPLSIVISGLMYLFGLWEI